jgi:hypothetical protein
MGRLRGNFIVDWRKTQSSSSRDDDDNNDAMFEEELWKYLKIGDGNYFKVS